MQNLYFYVYVCSCSSMSAAVNNATTNKIYSNEFLNEMF